MMEGYGSGSRDAGASEQEAVPDGIDVDFAHHDALGGGLGDQAVHGSGSPAKTLRDLRFVPLSDRAQWSSLRVSTMRDIFGKQTFAAQGSWMPLNRAFLGCPDCDELKRQARKIGAASADLA